MKKRWFLFYFWFIKYWGRLMKPFYYLLSFRFRRKSIPPAKGEIFYTSATTLARKIRLKQLTSEEVVTAFVSRCRQVNPIVNAIIDERFDQALQDAKNVDKLLQNDEVNIRDLEIQKPLLGIPITIKEAIKVKGMKHTNCVKKNANNRASSNSIPVKLLLNAGAIPIAVTSTPPYCSWFETVNDLIGYTPNPYDISRSVGGSSGGEAALLSCAASVIGLATDSGGSLSLPSAFTGVYGHKPSSGEDSCEVSTQIIADLIPYLDSLPQFSSLQNPLFRFTVAPMCRYVEDLELLLSVLSDKNYGVKSSQVNVGSLKIYYLEEINSAFPVDQTIKEKIVAAATYMREKHKCDVKQFEMKELKKISFIFTTGSSVIFGEFIKKLSPRNWLGRLFLSIYKRVVIPSPKEYEECFRIRSKLKNLMQEKLSNNGVLLMPAYTGLPFYRYESYLKVFDCHTSSVASILNLAATTIPVGLIYNKMPTGIQIIATQGQDRLCIAVAKELNKLFGGWQPPFTADSSHSDNM